MNWHFAMVRPNTEKRVVAELRELDPPFAAVWSRFVRREIVGGSRLRWRGRERIQTVEVSMYPNYIALASCRPWQDALKVDGLTRVLRVAGDREKAWTIPAEFLPLVLGAAGDGMLPDPDALPEARMMRQFIRGQEIGVSIGTKVRSATVLDVGRGRLRINVDGREMSIPVDVVTAA